MRLKILLEIGGKGGIDKLEIKKDVLKVEKVK